MIQRLCDVLIMRLYFVSVEVNEVGSYKARDYGCFAFDPVYKQIKKLPPKPQRLPIAI